MLRSGLALLPKMSFFFCQITRPNHGTVFQRNPKWRLLDSDDCSKIEDHSRVRQVARFSELKVSLVLIESAHCPGPRYALSAYCGPESAQEFAVIYTCTGICWYYYTFMQLLYLLLQMASRVVSLRLLFIWPNRNIFFEG